MASWVRWSLIAATLLIGGLWLCSGSRSRLEPRIDPAVFSDAERDAQPVSAAILPSDGGERKKPNLVLILADDLGYGDLASYGTRAIRTPHLDRLAREGVRFTEFYSSAPVCSPSRAGLLTGRYPVRTGVSYIIFASDVSFRQRMRLALAGFATRIGASDFHTSFVSGLPDSEITLAEALKVAGYATGMVGKWHLGDYSHDPRYLPTRHGFDFHEGIPHSNDEFPVAYFRGERQITRNVGLDQEHLTADFTRAAVEFIDANRDRPFFLYLAHKDVHLPFFPSKEFKGRSRAGAFGDATEELDWSVGRVLQALESRGLRENTLVVFTSDNGPWYEGSTQGLRGRKGTSFEGGQRVPMIASWPGRLPAGGKVDVPAMSIDLFPTFLGLAGLRLPDDRVIDGRDLWSLMTGRDTSSPHDALFFFHDKVIDGVRAGHWKYYRQIDRYVWPAPLDRPDTLAGRQVEQYTYTDPKTGRTIHVIPTFPLLYDMRLDPGESYNVAERYADDSRRLRGLIERWERDFTANPRGWH